MHLLKHKWTRLARTAWKNRQEIINAHDLTRRDLLKMGLLTSAGYLVAKHGLSSRVADAQVSSPFTVTPFVDPLPIIPIKRPVSTTGDVKLLRGPAPSIAPNNAGGEGRTRDHQAFVTYPKKFPFPPQILFQVSQQENRAISVHRDLPLQCMWGFDGIVPGPTYHARYGEQILVRNFNDLPQAPFCGGFGLNQVSTHLHNLHTPSESDGFPCDYFPDPQRPAIAKAFFYDHHYPNVLAGFASTHPPDGDINESLSTLWYHDHRVEFTAQNVYKGLAGFYLLFNQFDTGDENTGFHLPGVRDPKDFYANVQFDIPLMLNDKVFDEDREIFFDLANSDGILGDKFFVNGKIQPFLVVKPRRYRFRVLNSGPSRFYQIFLTEKGPGGSGLNTEIDFWHISNDGNLLPRPIKVDNIVVAVAERMDIVIDFAPWAGKTLYFENRLRQEDGRGPAKNIGEEGGLLPPGEGNFLLQFRVDAGTFPDNSVNFETTQVQFYALPPRVKPRIERFFRFDRTNGEWAINNRLMPADCGVVRFLVGQNTVEHWVLLNDSGGWMHPIHIHFEEFQMIDRNGAEIGPGNVEFARKDVVRLQHSERNPLFFRFRDFFGRFPMHCHNVVHEDHAMMLRWDIDPKKGDNKIEP
jgi:FtsP/CotA-like multicopper oxidase with cupredoxin domain